jgi:hypothetical protein
MEVGARGEDGGGMSKQRKSKPEPATLRMDADWRKKKMELDAYWLAKQIAALATMMWTVAERMEHFDRLNPNMKGRATMLASQGMMLDNWADEVRAQAKANKRGPMA